MNSGQEANPESSAPPPSKELLQKLELSPEQWDRLPKLEKRERLLVLLNADGPPSSGEGAPKKLEEPPPKEKKGGIGLKNYFRDDGEVSPPPLPMVNLNEALSSEETQKYAHFLGQRSQSANLGFDEVEEDDDSSL
jgi:hypothetical protein